MAFVIYHKNTHRIFTGRKGNRTWCTKWYAEKAAMKMNANMLGSVEPLLLVMSQEEYAATYGNKKELVRSAFDGSLVEIDINTPWSCNPESEAYWCN